MKSPCEPPEEAAPVDANDQESRIGPGDLEIEFEFELSDAEYEA